ncbi:hypothetical protein [Acinetobacter indicus]|uniref:hypothetical protein n=1 Tax=Acinetobacter indicus TaxID=756892 RepID=UPI0013151E4B|nr:hypothetical protein [Acinetobacter indicus]MDV4312303.1 hypothetical protein [Acinetobacter indicus]
MSKWQKIEDFQILKTQISCSSSPWRKGIDRTATMNVEYMYRYHNKIYYRNAQDALSIYRITLLESCADLKIKLENAWQQYNTDKVLSVYISSIGNESRLVIKENHFTFRKSLMALILFEAQGVILILVIIFILTCLITLLRMALLHKDFITI